MLPYLDKMGTRSELDAMIKEMARNKSYRRKNKKMLSFDDFQYKNIN